MKIHTETLKVITPADEVAVDITPLVVEVVQRSGVRHGRVLVYTTHTSSGLTVTEGIPCLEADLMSFFDKLAPVEGDYRHRRYLDFDGRIGFNAEDHLKSVLAGYQVHFAVVDGAIVKGGRQTIYFLEFDGPLERTVVVQVMGETGDTP
ncbi:MAG TPA: YjbQ family protein [Bacteroidetes bacterium]|nr:YjbQ family protein [Bacteroidota bacterium]